MSLKDCVLKKVFKEVLQAAFIAALPPSPLQKNFYRVAFLCITLKLTPHSL